MDFLDKQLHNSVISFRNFRNLFTEIFDFGSLVGYTVGKEVNVMADCKTRSSVPSANHPTRGRRYSSPATEDAFKGKYSFCAVHLCVLYCGLQP